MKSTEVNFNTNSAFSIDFELIQYDSKDVKDHVDLDISFDSYSDSIDIDKEKEKEIIELLSRFVEGN